MRLFRERRHPDSGPRTGILEDLERLARRARALPVAALALMVVGFGVGDLSKSYLELPDGTAARAPTENSVPRVRLEGLSRRLSELRSDGENTVEYVSMYKQHVAPVEKVLRRRGVGRTTARQIAWPLVQHSYERGLDPAFVVSGDAERERREADRYQSGGRPRPHAGDALLVRALARLRPQPVRD